jgi:hypothetical protein
VFISSKIDVAANEVKVSTLYLLAQVGVWVTDREDRED